MTRELILKNIAKHIVLDNEETNYHFSGLGQNTLFVKDISWPDTPQ